MKRILGVAFILTAVCSAVWAEEPGAYFLWTEGDVRVETPGAGESRPADEAETMPQGSRVVTGVGAECGIGTEGPLQDSVLKLAQNSSVLLTDLGDQAHVDLRDGSISVKLKDLSPDSRFEVQTPTAVASARGTGWSQSKDSVEVFDGSVHVNAAGGQEQDLLKDEAVDLTGAGVMSAKRPAGAPGQQAWDTFQRDISNSMLRVKDIQDLRDAIDAKRASAPCGAAAPYAWGRPLAAGEAISASTMNELKSALSEEPFEQSQAYVKDYLEPMPSLSAGDRIQVSYLRRLRKAVEKASC